MPNIHRLAALVPGCQAWCFKAGAVGEDLGEVVAESLDGRSVSAGIGQDAGEPCRIASASFSVATAAGTAGSGWRAVSGARYTAMPPISPAATSMKPGAIRLWVLSTRAAAIRGVVPPNSEVEMLYVMDSAPARTRVGNSVGSVPGSVLLRPNWSQVNVTVARNGTFASAGL
jgi:hypothetical protein